MSYFMHKDYWINLRDQFYAKLLCIKLKAGKSHFSSFEPFWLWEHSFLFALESLYSSKTGDDSTLFLWSSLKACLVFAVLLRLLSKHLPRWSLASFKQSSLWDTMEWGSEWTWNVDFNRSMAIAQHWKLGENWVGCFSKVAWTYFVY